MSTKHDDPLHPNRSNSMENFTHRSYKDYARARNNRRKEQWCIEGEYVTSTDVAERLGVDAPKARMLIFRAAKLPGATTWEVLKSLTTRKGKAQ